jgi:hypothetical protein
MSGAIGVVGGGGTGRNIFSVGILASILMRLCEPLPHTAFKHVTD